jgi:hypothetical protein
MFWDTVLSDRNLPTVRRNMLPPSLGYNNDSFSLKMEAAISFETLENIYQTFITFLNTESLIFTEL